MFLPQRQQSYAWWFPDVCPLIVAYFRKITEAMNLWKWKALDLMIFQVSVRKSYDSSLISLVDIMSPCVIGISDTLSRRIF